VWCKYLDQELFEAEKLLDTLERRRLSRISVVWSDDSCEGAAHVYGKVTDEAYKFEEVAFEVSPKVELCVLNKSDWMKIPFCRPQPYGDPICPEGRIFVGNEAPTSWKDYTISVVKDASQAVKDKLLVLSGAERGNDVKVAVESLFSLQFFAGSLAHEIAHIFQAGALMIPHNIDFDGIEKRGDADKLDVFWIGEFVCQYAQFGFLMSHDAGLCDKWLRFYQIWYESAKDLVHYRKMSEWGSKYPEIRIRNLMSNILWYQSKAMLMASELYAIYGTSFLKSAKRALGISHNWAMSNLTSEVKGFDRLLDEWDRR
jgi:hypothetical protein